MNKKSIKLIITLIAIFLIPMIAARGYFYYITTSGNYSTINKGHIISPLIALKKPTLKGKWTILYVLPHRCTDQCKTILHYMHQIQLALGKNANRIRRALLPFSAKRNYKKATDQYPKLDIVHVAKKQFAKNIHALPSHKKALSHGYIYIVDPMSNLMMSYAPDTSPDDILVDLERLLKVSQIG